MTLRRLSLRIKLTLVFVGVMGLVLAAIGTFLFFRTRASLDGAIRDSLRTRAGTLVESIHRPGRSLIEPGERFAQVLTQDGAMLDSRPQGAAPLLRPRELRGLSRAQFIEQGEQDRLLATPARAGGRDVIAIVGASLADREQALEGLSGSLLVGGPLALLLASALGYWIAGAALRPVELMRQRALEITTADSRARLPVPASEDEIHRLATTLNDMLARLAKTADHERAFVANASHELRTPLATIRAELELAVRHAGTLEEFREAARSAIRDGDGLTRLADDLLVLARADSGRLPIRPEDIDVVELLRGVAAELARDPRLGPRTVRVSARDATTAYADPDRLEQALRNMAVNAMVHGTGAITLGAETEDDVLRLWVTDEGPPLSEATLAVAFDRFARAPSAAQLPGSGLGLSIVRELARLHEGDARMVNTTDGVSCILELPRIPVSARPTGPHSVDDGAPVRADP